MIAKNLNNDLVASRGLLGLAEDVDVPARLVCKVNELVIHPHSSYKEEKSTY